MKIRITREGPLSDVGHLPTLAALGETELRAINRKLRLPGHDDSAYDPACVAWMGLADAKVRVTLEFLTLP